jgi:hypothetical protein
VTEEPSLADMTSEYGWIKADYNKARWVPCPRNFPAEMPEEEWARRVATIWWQTARTKFGDRQVRSLEQSLIYVHDNIFSQPCHLVLIHLPDARVSPLPVCFGIWRSAGSRDERLRMLVHADDPVSVQPPILEEVWTEELGTGLKCLYYQKQHKGREVIGVLNYAWRSDEYKTDLRVFTATSNLGRLEQAMPDIDELTKVIQFIPRNTEGE